VELANVNYNIELVHDLNADETEFAKTSVEDNDDGDANNIRNTILQKMNELKKFWDDSFLGRSDGSKSKSKTI
jgi:hypothetical protein